MMRKRSKGHRADNVSDSLHFALGVVTLVMLVLLKEDAQVPAEPGLGLFHFAEVSASILEPDLDPRRQLLPRVNIRVLCLVEHPQLAEGEVRPRKGC